MAEVDKKEMEEARELVANQLLWPRVRDFLWDFAPQIHASWIVTLKVEGLKVAGLADSGLSDLRPSDLRPSTNLSSRVKAWLLNELGVVPCFHAFPKEDGSRLLLLDGATILEVAKWLGALACAEELRRVTDGATVRELKAELPGVYPEVFGYTAYFGLGSHRGTEGTEAQRIAEEGCKMLFALLADLPETMRTRLKLQLPKNLCASAPSLPLCEINLSIVNKLLKLKFPEAYKLCCS